MPGLLYFHDFLNLTFKFLLLGLNLFMSDGKLLLSLPKMKALLLSPSLDSFCTLPLPLSLSQLKDEVLTFFLNDYLGLNSRDPACFLILELGLSLVHPILSHMSYLDCLYKQKKTKDKVSEKIK